MNSIVQRVLAVLVAMVAVSAAHSFLPASEAQIISGLIAALAAGWVPTDKRQS